MSINAIFTVLFLAKVPLAISALGFVMVSGAAAMSIAQKNMRHGELRKLKSSHRRREAALKAAVDLARAEASQAQEWVSAQTSVAEQASGKLAQLQHGLVVLKAERDRALAAAEVQMAHVSRLNAELMGCRRDRNLMASQFGRLDSGRSQLTNELYEMAVAEADFTANVAELQTRIAQLEAALTAKTEMATQMLTELEKDATDTFTQFSQKISTQDRTIAELQQHIKTLKRTNAALLSKQQQRRQSQNTQEKMIMAG